MARVNARTPAGVARIAFLLVRDAVADTLRAGATLRMAWEQHGCPAGISERHFARLVHTLLGAVVADLPWLAPRPPLSRPRRREPLSVSPDQPRRAILNPTPSITEFE